MEGSWRMRPTPILPNYPPRRSTDSYPKPTISDDDILSTDDFADVFGGAPRTILSHQFSTPGCFYENIFRQPDKEAAPVMRSGQNLPRFRIPSGKQNSSDRNQQNLQHGENFGWEGETLVRSRTRSKASSSSALSSEELSPLRPAISGDGYEDVSFFASKLRPINVKSRWDSTRIGNRDQHRHKNMTISENQDFLENLKNYSFQRNEFVESANVESVFPDDLQFNSPASAVSSLSDMETCDEISKKDDKKEEEEEEEEDDDDDDEESMSSYVIEIISDFGETKCDESNGVDEAIAWVREMFQTQSSKEKSTQEDHHSEGTTNSSPSVLNEGSTVEETSNESALEMQLLDEKIRLWSLGNEADIRLLLSSMHYILWPGSGWTAISATNLIGGSQVKKAYLKAVLCLHPDKLQQRGATLKQKYIAEKAFSALQDAWAKFTSPQDEKLQNHFSTA